MNDATQTFADVDRWQKRALLIGGAALALSMAGAFAQQQEFFRAYLIGYLLWLGVALGCFAILMLHHMVGGGWGFVIRRLLEAGTRTLPVLAILFVPLLLGIHPLYEWSHEQVVAADKILQAKSVYLNIPFFIGRAAAYFAVWIGIAWVLNRWSLEQDRTRDPSIVRRLQLLSGPGLLLYGLTATFASVDWVMSLEPHWFSTIYGLLFIVGQGLSTLSFVVIVAWLLADRAPMKDALGPSHFHDLGNLMLAFVMLWAYMAFSQFLIIWSGNLPEETTWYMNRTRHGWQWVGVFLLVFHWALPFVLLLLRRTKRSGGALARVAAAMIVMRLIDLFWVVTPAFEHKRSHFQVHWLDPLPVIGIGGIWLWAYFWQLKKQPLLPQGDTRMDEAFAHAREHA